MSCEIMFGIIQTGRGNSLYNIVYQEGKWLRIIYSNYTLEDIYSADFRYKPPKGKTIDDLFVNNMKPKYDISYTYKWNVDNSVYRASVVIETKHSFVLDCLGVHIVYDKEDIEYEITYEQENLDFIDEL